MAQSTLSDLASFFFCFSISSTNCYLYPKIAQDRSAPHDNPISFSTAPRNASAYHIRPRPKRLLVDIGRLIARAAVVVGGTMDKGQSITKSGVSRSSRTPRL